MEYHNRFSGFAVEGPIDVGGIYIAVIACCSQFMQVADLVFELET